MKIKNKSNEHTVEAIIELDYPKNKDYILELLRWTYDFNIPIAGDICGYLESLKEEQHRVLTFAISVDYHWHLLTQLSNKYFDELEDDLKPLGVELKSFKNSENLGKEFFLQNRNRWLDMISFSDKEGVEFFAIKCSDREHRDNIFKQKLRDKLFVKYGSYHYTLVAVCMTGILNNIRRWFYHNKKNHTDNGVFNENFLEKLSDCEEFIIYDKGKPVAEFSSPTPNEQFWTLYDLNPLSSDDANITRLYSDDFWLSKDIRFSTKEPKMPCKFLLAIDIDEEDPDDPNEETEVKFAWIDESGKMVSLADKPKQLLLRGPYPVKAKSDNSIQKISTYTSEKELIKSSVIELGNYEIGCFYNMLTDFNNHIIPELIKMRESSYSHNVFLIEDKTLNYEDILEADSYEYFKSLNIFQELQKIFQLANYWYQECHDKDSAIDTEKEIRSMAKNLHPQILEFCKNLREVARDHGNDEYFSNIN